MHPLCCYPWGTEGELQPCKGAQQDFLKAHRGPRPADSHLPGFSDLQWVIRSHWSKTKKTPKEVKNSSSHLVLLAVTWVVITMITLMAYLALKANTQDADSAFIFSGGRSCENIFMEHQRSVPGQAPAWDSVSPSLGHPAYGVVWQSQEFYGAMVWEQGCDCRWVPFARQTGWHQIIHLV